MNITSGDGKWEITDETSGCGCFIKNRETGEMTRLDHTPSATTIAHMNYNTFLRKCASAFATGIWPQTRWRSGAVTD